MQLIATKTLCISFKESVRISSKVYNSNLNLMMKNMRSIIKECEGNWQLNHKVPKIKFCDETIYTGGILNGVFHGNGN